jgi:hypothetical protein
MSPSQTLSTKPVPGRKKDKSRITVLLGSNATGTDKLKPWVIGNAKRPRSLSKVNLERLPVYYRGNPKAWMNSSVFEEVLREMDNYFRIQNKKILLLIDNAPSHFNPYSSSTLEVEQDNQDEDGDGEIGFAGSSSSGHDGGGSRGRGRGSRGRGRGSRGRGGGPRGRGGGSRGGHGGELEDDESRGHGSHSGRSNIFQQQLTHIEVVFLPPNTTSHLQPLDAGIIASFKSHFKRKYCRHMLDLFEDGKDINKEKISIKEAINYIVEAWGCVTEETIQNCWKKTGILPLSNEDVHDAIQTQEEKAEEEDVDINQMITELDTNDPSATLLADALNNFFNDLEGIPTEDVLDENDIIKLVRKEMHNDNESNEDSDSEEEQMPISLSDALKSLQTWITFFEQQQTDEFCIADMKTFNKYFKIIKRLELQSRKQTSITNFFSG